MSNPDPAATLRALVTALIEKMDAVHASQAFKAQAITAYVHGVTYDGPNYAAEFKAVKAALAASPARETPETQAREKALRDCERALEAAIEAYRQEPGERTSYRLGVHDGYCHARALVALLQEAEWSRRGAETAQPTP